MTITINEATLYVDSACVFIGCAGLVFAVWAHGRLDVARRFLGDAENRLSHAKEQRFLVETMVDAFRRREKNAARSGQPNGDEPEGEATK